VLKAFKEGESRRRETLNVQVLEYHKTLHILHINKRAV